MLLAISESMHTALKMLLHLEFGVDARMKGGLMSHPHHPAMLFDKDEPNEKDILIFDEESCCRGENCKEKDDNDEDIVILTKRPIKGTLYKCPRSPQPNCEVKLSKYSRKEAPPEVPGRDCEAKSSWWKII